MENKFRKLCENYESEIEQLKADKESYYHDYRMKFDVETKQLHTEIQQLKSKLAKAKETLEFYGSPKTYFYVEHPDGLEGRGDITVMKDLGSKAINALSEIGDG